MRPQKTSAGVPPAIGTYAGRDARAPVGDRRWGQRCYNPTAAFVRAFFPKVGTSTPARPVCLIMFADDRAGRPIQRQWNMRIPSRENTVATGECMIRHLLPATRYRPLPIF